MPFPVGRSSFGELGVQCLVSLYQYVVARLALFYKLYEISDLSFQAYVGNVAEVAFGVYARHISRVRVAVWVAVFYVEYHYKFIAVFDSVFHSFIFLSLFVGLRSLFFGFLFGVKLALLLVVVHDEHTLIF